MKKKEKQKKRKAYEPKLTPEGNIFAWFYDLQLLFTYLECKHDFFFFLVEMMDSSTFKRFTASIENILDNLEDMDFTAFGKISLQGFLFVYPFVCV